MKCFLSPCLDGLVLLLPKGGSREQWTVSLLKDWSAFVKIALGDQTFISSDEISLEELVFSTWRYALDKS